MNVPPDPSETAIHSQGLSGPAASGSVSPAQPATSSEDAPVALGTGSTARRSAGLIHPDQPTLISTKPPLVVGHAGLPPGSSLDALEGQMLDHYQVERFVGGGGMGAVFRATDTRLQRSVALKILARESAADPETLQRFLNEARSAARLDHENIARVYYVGHDRDLHFIAFEFIEGENVRDLVDRHGPFSIPDVVRDGLQLAEALAHTAGRDVVHRDIKPSNLLITAEGRVKLVDMGLARMHQVERSSPDLTASGVTLGTFDYISPEQARDPRVADVRSDIYSLGCTLFFMLTGRPPFPEGTVLQKLLQHQGDEPPNPRALRADVPEGLARIVLRALAKDPRQRYQTAEALIGDLALLAEELGVPLDRPLAAEWSRAGIREFSLVRHLPWLVPVAALLLAVAVLDLSSRWPSVAWQTRVPPPERTANSPMPAPRSTHVRPRPSVPASSGRRATATVAGPEAQVPAVEQSPGPTEVVGKSKFAEPTAPGIGRAPIATGAAPPPNSDGPASPARTDASEPAPAAAGIAVDAEGAGLALPAEGALTLAAHFEPGSRGPREPVAIDPQRSDVLVVGQAAQGERQFDSLGTACAAARPGDVVELRFNGRRVESPFALATASLTIRSGEGFQPVVVFRPDSAAIPTDSEVMLSLVGGRITLVDLAFELDLATHEPEGNRVALLALEQVELLRAENCSFTLRAPMAETDRGVSCFLLRPAAAAIAASSELALPQLRFENCVVRGEGNCFLAESAADCEWHNGLVVVGGRFLEVAVPVSVGAPSGYFELEHLTVWTREGFASCVVADGAAPSAALAMHVANSILAGGPGSALVELRVPAPLANRERNVRWTSQRNHYDGFSAYWRVIDSRNGQALSETLWSDWHSFWAGSREAWGPVGWNVPPAPERAWSSAEPDDFRLSPRSPARSAATDHLDVGFEALRLPLLPRSGDQGQNEPALEENPSASSVVLPAAPGSPLEANR